MLNRLAAYTAVSAGALAVVILSINTHGMLELLSRGALPAGCFSIAMTALLPTVLTVVIPIATGIAVIHGYGEWASHGELVALRSVGAGDGLIAAPGIVLGASGMALTAAMSLYLLPVSFRVFEDIRYGAITDVAVGALHEGVNRMEAGLSLAFDAWQSRTEVAGVAILDSRTPGRLVSIRAERGELVPGSAGGGRPAILLRRGEYLSREPAGPAMRMRFEELLLPLVSDVPAARAWRGFFEEHVDELLRSAAVDPADRLIRAAEAHRRIASPLLALGYAILGCAIMLRARVGSAGAPLRALLLLVAVICWHGLMALGHAGIGRFPALVVPYYVLALLPSIAGGALLAGASRVRPIRVPLAGAALPESA